MPPKRSKAEEVTEQAFRAKMASFVLKPSEKGLVNRTLENLSNEDPSIDLNNAENKKVIGCLRALGVNRINPAAFSTWKQKVVHTEALKHPVWIQKKSVKPNLDKDPDMQEWIYDPEEIDGHIEKDLYWFVDSNCPCLERIGKGARQWEATITIKTVARPASSSAWAENMFTPATTTAAEKKQTSPPGSTGGQEHTDAEVTPKTEYRGRLLGRNPSDPDKNDAKHTEELAQSTEAAF